ncbi:hypothetical protein [Sphingomonas oryzagri]
MAFLNSRSSIFVSACLMALLPPDASIAAQPADDVPSPESVAAVRTYSIALLGRYR